FRRRLLFLFEATLFELTLALVFTPAALQLGFALGGAFLGFGFATFAGLFGFPLALFVFQGDVGLDGLRDLGFEFGRRFRRRRSRWCRRLGLGLGRRRFRRGLGRRVGVVYGAGF